MPRRSPVVKGGKRKCRPRRAFISKKGPGFVCSQRITRRGRATDLLRDNDGIAAVRALEHWLADSQTAGKLCSHLDSQRCRPRVTPRFDTPPPEWPRSQRSTSTNYVKCIVRRCRGSTRCRRSRSSQTVPYCHTTEPALADGPGTVTAGSKNPDPTDRPVVGAAATNAREQERTRSGRHLSVPGQSADARPRRRLLVVKAALALGFLGALIALLVTEHDYVSTVVSDLAHARPSLIVWAIVCEWISMVSFAWMQRWLLRAGGLQFALESLLAITFAGNAISVSIPIAGSGLSAAFTYRELERRQVSKPAAAFVPAVSGFLSTVTFLVIVAGGALASGNPVAGVLGLAGALGIVAGVVAAALAVRIGAIQHFLDGRAVWLIRLMRRIRRRTGDPPEEVVQRAREQLSGLRLRRRDWLLATSGASFNWLGDAACLALSIRAAHVAIPLRDLILIWSVGSAANSVGLTPGGVGVVEVALVAALVSAHVPAAQAGVAVIIYRLISLWLVLIVGWILFLVLKSRNRDTKLDT